MESEEHVYGRTEVQKADLGLVTSLALSPLLFAHRNPPLPCFPLPISLPNFKARNGNARSFLGSSGAGLLDYRVKIVK